MEKFEGHGQKTMRKQGSEGRPIGESFLTLSEAAEVLRLSTRTVREYIRRGEIRGKLIGKRWRFRRADLDAFFESAPSQWDFAGKNNHGD
jgi:excisionase family DNA binding protein